MKRCKECRERFTPAVTAAGHQQVCGPACRKRRRAKLTRRRRRDGDLEATREDERERQRTSRDARAAKAVPTREPCHKPASAGKSLMSQDKVTEIVDRLVRLSLTTLSREATRIVRNFQAFATLEGSQRGP
jgi:hypothetical protein